MNDAVYLALYAMAAAVDEWLKRGGHLRDSQGRMITHFDEWLQAVERGEWTSARRTIPAMTEWLQAVERGEWAVENGQQS